MNWARKLFEYVRDFGVNPTSDLLTDNNGPNRRFRVDVGQTGFFAGRVFRTYKRVESLSAGSRYLIKMVTDVNVIIHEVSVRTSAGDAHVKMYVGGTESVALNDSVLLVSCNTMTERPFPYYVSVVDITNGAASVSGGTEIDFLEAQTAGTGNQKVANVGDSLSEEFGIGPGTYFFEMLAASDTSLTATLYVKWEERP